VCGEERIALVLGWDDPSSPLQANIRNALTASPVGDRLAETVRLLGRILEAAAFLAAESDCVPA
jgi:hypothetical protein